MTRRSQIYVLTAILFLGVALAALLSTGQVEAGDGCGPCSDAVRLATGTGFGANCTQATHRARIAALNQAWSGAPACSPCQIADDPIQSPCVNNSCVGSGCANKTKKASWTISYRCQTCSLEGPETPNP